MVGFTVQKGEVRWMLEWRFMGKILRRLSSMIGDNLYLDPDHLGARLEYLLDLSFMQELKHLSLTSQDGCEPLCLVSSLVLRR
jgi:hypothetical protein